MGIVGGVERMLRELTLFGLSLGLLTSASSPPKGERRIQRDSDSKSLQTVFSLNILRQQIICVSFVFFRVLSWLNTTCH
jgi:hypothetical protein